MLECRLSEDADFRATLDKALATHNDEQSIWHRNIRQTGGQPVDIAWRVDGQLTGGLYGEIYWESFEIDRLWVDSNHRNQGIARALVTAAEETAREHHCRFIHLTTFSFQAPDFYQKAGYEIVGQQQDFPPGFQKFWLRKNL